SIIYFKRRLFVDLSTSNITKQTWWTWSTRFLCLYQHRGSLPVLAESRQEDQDEFCGIQHPERSLLWSIFVLPAITFRRCQS
ncbi:unnamed protein product, partial [Amoebophrya sp. A120]